MGCAICNNPKFIYTHIPKTGGTSLFSRRSRATRQLQKHHPITIISGHRYLRYLGKRYDLSNYLTFATVRNPYDRFISLWLTNKARTGLTLSEFILSIRKREVRWNALKQQCTWIRDYEGNLLTDELLRFENYEHDLSALFKKLGLHQVKLPRLRKTQRDPNYSTYYEDEDQIAFVSKMYRDDLALFNYTF